MKTKKLHQLFRLSSIIFVGLMISLTSQSQALNQEFITAFNGDLWKFDVFNNTSTQLTTSGYNHGPVLSPDGLKIAFNSIPPESLARFSRGEYVSDGVYNINVMDIATGQITVIADQTGARTEGILRSFPVWSPDSSKVLWAELNNTTQVFQIYDMNTLTTSIFADNLAVMIGDADMVGFSQIEWSPTGITTMVLDYGSTEIMRLLEIYYYPSTDIATFSFPLELYGFKWVNYQGLNLILLEGENRYELYDPATGSTAVLNSPPRLKSKFYANGVELFQVQTNTNPLTLEWYLDDGQSTYATGYTGWTIPTLSPDGFTVAWHDEDGISIWESGIGETKLADNPPYDNNDYLKPQGSSSVVWSVMESVIIDTVTLSQPGRFDDNCFDSPPTRLTQAMNPLMNAIVTPGESNNIRDRVGGSVIGKIPAGSGMLITGESICDSNGIRYYPIIFDGIVGWTAEGQGNDYWLAPIGS